MIETTCGRPGPIEAPRAAGTVRRAYRVKTVVGLAMLSLFLLGSNLPGQLKQNPGKDGLRQGESVPAGAVAVVDGDPLPIPEFVSSIYERYVGHARGIESMEDLIKRRVIETQMKRRALVINDAELNAYYQQLDQQYRQATQGKMTIEKAIADEGYTKTAFMSRLRLQLALKKMTATDFKREDISAADQEQWLRSKKLDAKLEQDPAKLPANAAARIYDGFITQEEFARNVIRLLPERDVIDLARTRLEARLAKRMAKAAGITITDKDRREQYQIFKNNFTKDPKFQGIAFEDFIKERTGMTIEAYRRGPGFEREVALNKLGKIYVPDDQAAKVYDEHKRYFGPLMDVRHIFIRGSKNASSGNQPTRSMNQAKEQCAGILERINKGAKFDELVKIFSEDPNSKFKGGNLQVFTPASAETFPALAKVLGTMKAGDIRGPIESSRGYHVIKLESKRPAPPLSPEIVADLRKRVAFERFRETWKQSKRGIDLRRFLDGGK